MARLRFLWSPYGPGGPWGVPGESLQGPKRVQIWNFGRFEAITGFPKPYWVSRVLLGAPCFLGGLGCI